MPQQASSGIALLDQGFIDLDPPWYPDQARLAGLKRSLYGEEVYRGLIEQENRFSPWRPKKFAETIDQRGWERLSGPNQAGCGHQ